MSRYMFFLLLCVSGLTSLTGLGLKESLLARELSDDIISDDLFSLSLEELITVKVTVASKFFEPDERVGSSVARITPEHWRRLGARLTPEVLINQTAVMVLPGILGENPIFIRGYASQSSGALIMIDNVPILSSSNGSSEFLKNFGLGTLSEIELIKGPGSAIYGSDAFHGVVAYNTFASDKDYYYAEAAGAYPFYGNAGIKVSHGLADGRIRIDMASSLAGQDDRDLKYPFEHGFFPANIFYPGQPGQIPGAGTGSRKNKYQTQTGVFKLTITPEKRARIKLGTYMVRNKIHGYPGISSLVGNLREKDTTSQDALFLMGTGGVSYRYDNDITLEAKGYYWWTEAASILNVDEYGSFNYLTGDEYRTGMELTIKQPDNAIGLQWLLAYSFAAMKINSVKSTSFNAVYGRFTNQYDELFAGFSRDIHSLYAQTKWGVIRDKVYLLLGGRLDHYSDFGNHLTPRGGLIYLPTDKFTLKALYGRGFRAGNGQELVGVRNYIKGDPDIRPEVIDVYELIFMYSHKKLKAAVNGFYSYWKDGIIQKVAPELLPNYSMKFVNEGKNQAYGGEINLLYCISPLALELGFSYVKSIALNVADPNNAASIIDQTYVAYPEYFINAGLYYSIERLAINVYLNNRVYLNMKEAPYAANANPSDLPAYWRTDLDVSKVIAEKTEVTLNIRNLFDRENQVPSLFGAKDGVEEPGISVLLRASRRF